jgi:hypothetical protein
MSTPASLVTFECMQQLGTFFPFPARMTALVLADGGVALISPIPIDDALASRIAALGPVRYLIAPNLLHHLYLGAASARYPDARVLAPAGLAAKRPELRIDAMLDGALPEALTAAVDVVHMAGVPSIDEFVFFHRASRTLVVTDLVFNIMAPRGLFRLVLRIVGCHRRLAQSRAWRFAVKDRAAAGERVARMLGFPFETLVMAHGEIVREAAHARLAEALRWLLPVRIALPAT